MAVDARGVLSGLIIAPAFGAAACVAGMMVHFVTTDPAGAELTLGQLMPMAGAVWFSALMFAYPAALGFLVIWLALRVAGLGGAGLWIGGLVAGFGAMAAYLQRVHEGGFTSALAGGRDLATLTLPEVPGVFALPLIGAASGLLAAFLFGMLARR
jgi:hypothetical protein